MTRTFTTGATRDADDTKLDYEGFLSPTVAQRFAEYMNECRTRSIPEGQTVRASDNWQKGIPLDSYMKSMFRHFMEVWLMHRGHPARNEKGQFVSMQTALCALFFNVQGYLHEMLKQPTPQPLPASDPVIVGTAVIAQ